MAFNSDNVRRQVKLKMNTLCSFNNHTWDSCVVQQKCVHFIMSSNPDDATAIHAQKQEVKIAYAF